MAALLQFYLLATGCTSHWKCPRQALAEPIYVIDHILGGEAPRAESIGVYADGTIVHSFVGGSKSCALLGPSQLNDLAAVVTKLKEFKTPQDLGVDWEEIWILQGTERIGIAVDDRRPELLFTLQELDQILAPTVGKRYTPIVEFLGSSA